jgi:predicted 3-demethylubiquinone-9 3-methyltransferase (glyoxalase superfamily)
MSDFELNDFGFTAVDEDELAVVQTQQAVVSQTEAKAESTQDQLDSLYNAITPLLNNLKANPEREYILWPNRTAKIEEFEKKLFDIYNK